MTLRAWMLSQGLDDATVAERIGVSRFTVRSLRLRTRGPSARVLARVFEITGGAVLPPDMVRLKSYSTRSGRAASAPTEACPP